MSANTTTTPTERDGAASSRSPAAGRCGCTVPRHGRSSSSWSGYRLRCQHDRPSADVLRDLRDRLRREQAGGGIDGVRTTYLLVTYGAFGVIGAALFGFGVSVAVERGQGWMRLKRVAPMPPLAYFVAKVLMSLAFATIIVVGLFALGALLGGVRLGPGQWAAVGLALVAGALPFSAMGLAFGYLVGPNSAPAVLNLAWLPMAFASGLWIPIGQLPPLVQSVAPFLPPYHFVQLALGTIGASEGGSPVAHAGAVLGFTVVFLLVAAWGFRRDEDAPTDETRAAVNQRIIRYAPYLWLVYLIVLGFQPTFDPDTTAVNWVATAVTVVAFLPLYRAGLAERDQRRLTVLLAAMAGLGVVGTLVNAAAGVFIVYAAALAGRLSPLRRAVRTVAVLAGLAGVTFLISPTPMPWRLLAVVPIVVFVLVIGATRIIDGERARTQAQLRRADEEIERLATIAERERIARDLHDLLGHTLSVIVLKAELASRLLPADPDRAGQEMREVEQTARTALGEVRTAVAGYRAKGLGAELVNSQRALAAAGVDADAEVDLPVLPAEHEATLALALREAVTNVVRHADARRTSIRARATVDDVELEVTDDGRRERTRRAACRACGNGSWPWAARSTCRRDLPAAPDPAPASSCGCPARPPTRRCRPPQPGSEHLGPARRGPAHGPRRVGHTPRSRAGPRRRRRCRRR